MFPVDQHESETDSKLPYSSSVHIGKAVCAMCSLYLSCYVEQVAPDHEYTEQKGTMCYVWLAFNYNINTFLKDNSKWLY